MHNEIGRVTIRVFASQILVESGSGGMVDIQPGIPVDHRHQILIRDAVQELVCEILDKMVKEREARK